MRSQAPHIHQDPLFVHSPIGMGIVGLDHRWMRVNAALCAMLGYSEDQLLTDAPATVFSHPDDVAIAHAAFDSLLAGAPPAVYMNKRCIHAAGYIVWSRLTVSLYRDVDNAPLYFLLQFEDITESVRARQELTRQQTLLGLITENAQDLISCFDLEGRFTFISPSFNRTLGYPTSALLGAKAIRIIHNDDRPESRLLAERVITSGKGELSHLRALHMDGSTVWLEGSTQPIFEANRITGVVCIARDASHHTHLSQRVALVERQVAISTLATSVAHELNNPLAYSLSSIELALTRFGGSLDEELHDILRDAHDGTLRALEIIRDLQILSTPATLDRASHHAANLLHAAVKLAAKLHPPPCPIRIDDLDPDMRIWTNQSSFNQIIINLIGCAVRALANTPSPRLQIGALLTTSGDILFTFEDNGAVIPPDALPHTFDPFASSRSHNDGLGLAICYRIVADLDGSISCTSSPDATTFRVHLPATSDGSSTNR
jgi:two-component system cell cycle sensor histidine kinase/response regulator CckA